MKGVINEMKIRCFCGFTLVELLVVIAIIGILGSIGTLSFNAFIRKANVEKVTMELNTDLSQARLSAMTRKQTHDVTFNRNSAVFKRYSSNADVAGTVVVTKDSVSPIQVSTFGADANNLRVVFDAQGYVVGSTATIVIGTSDDGPAYNCLVISVSRTNMGKMNATTCEFK